MVRLLWKRMMRTLLLACALLLLVPASSPAQRKSDIWATVNVCDTAGSPNTVGVRGSMPGLRRRATLRMRFRVQYLGADGRWRMVRQNGDSHWRRVAVRRGGRVESGWSFEFAQPSPGGNIVLRGVVYFQWRHAGHVIARAKRITEDGHVSTAGADPPGFSAGTCRIS
jgi:hypothetical protein